MGAGTWRETWLHVWLGGLWPLTSSRGRVPNLVAMTEKSTLRRVSKGPDRMAFISRSMRQGSKGYCPWTPTYHARGRHVNFDLVSCHLGCRRGVRSIVVVLMVPGPARFSSCLSPSVSAGRVPCCACVLVLHADNLKIARPPRVIEASSRPHFQWFYVLSTSSTSLCATPLKSLLSFKHESPL